MSTVTDRDLLSPELTEDPFPYYAELRASDPVHWAPASKAWLLTRYDDVVAAFGDPRLSSDRVRPLLDVLPRSAAPSTGRCWRSSAAGWWSPTRLPTPG